MEKRLFITFMITLNKNIKKFTEELDKTIRESKKILLVSHINPDPDTLGSQIALWHVIKLKYKNKKIHLYNKNIEKTKTLKEILDAVNYIKNKTDNFYDLIIGLEPSNFERLGLKKNLKFRKIFIIDHHLTLNKESFKNYDCTIYFDPKKEACTGIIYDICKVLKVNISLQIKKAIILGILSDTVFLKYAKSKLSFKILYELIDENINLREFNKALLCFEIKDYKEIIKILKNAKFLKGRIAIFNLANSKLSNEKRSMIYEFARFLRDVILYIFIDKNQKIYEYHLRSDYIDVSRISKIFNGGGHKNAAAFNSPLKPKKIIEQIKKLIK